MSINPALHIYDERIKEILQTNFEIEVLDNTCSFSEGPVWNKEGFYLFSDIPQNVICKIIPGEAKQIFIEQSGCTHNDTTILAEQLGSNGLTYDNEGQLLICQHGNGAVAKWDGESVKPFISKHNNRRFNSPNDIVVHHDGTIFFSDPPYGLKDQKLVPEKFQLLAGIYCWRNQKLILVCDQYQYPNGVCLSPDHTILYCCSNKPSEKFILAYNAKTLELIGKLCKENSDGIKCDAKGNLFLCAREGMVILDGKGKRLGVISLKTILANCCWGGEEGKDLFITARENIYLIRNLQR
jgi:gluconolactonase